MAKGRGGCGFAPLAGAVEEDAVGRAGYDFGLRGIGVEIEDLAGEGYGVVGDGERFGVGWFLGRRDLAFAAGDVGPSAGPVASVEVVMRHGSARKLVLGRSVAAGRSA